MLSKIKSCSLVGIDGHVVEVETDISNGMPAFEIVGLADTAVKESKERVRSAIKNTGLEFPIRRITVNLAPASLRKEGSLFDLPIAIGILASTYQINNEYIDFDKYMFVGELSLDGEIKPVNGILSVAICAFYSGIENLVLPRANADEAAVIKGVNVLPVKNISELVDYFNGKQSINRYCVDIDSFFNSSNVDYGVDFADVKGQENVKRALEVVASGLHNCLMIGPPGAGKTMLARRLPTILPPLTFDEALEVTRIHSIAGMLPPRASLVTVRPFRSPHHTISDIGLIGGGKQLKPGEVCLAHYGILFLDELPEFSRDALEALRQPLEDGTVTITRFNSSLTYPARFTLIASANPCRCGRYLDGSGQCSCTPNQIRQYMGKLSSPLLDRIDIHIEVTAVKYGELEEGKNGERSEVIRKRVERARKIQLERYKTYKIYSNSQLTPSLIKKYCKIDEKGKALIKDAFERLGLSARAYNRILKVSRTIADMEGSEDIKPCHLAEAIQLRSMDRRFMGR